MVDHFDPAEATARVEDARTWLAQERARRHERDLGTGAPSPAETHVSDLLAEVERLAGECDRAHAEGRAAGLRAAAGLARERAQKLRAEAGATKSLDLRDTLCFESLALEATEKAILALLPEASRAPGVSDE